MKIFYSLIDEEQLDNYIFHSWILELDVEIVLEDSLMKTVEVSASLNRVKNVAEPRAGRRHVHLLLVDPALRGPRNLEKHENILILLEHQWNIKIFWVKLSYHWSEVHGIKSICNSLPDKSDKGIKS